ncbi:hypothetical protein RIF29_15442 [Crotalaria pallida]|uniref:Secreted protein n=1 Tax=Crotalaria pallida TaxID=3830 RepID=A0AAN9ICL3_CROPI
MCFLLHLIHWILSLSLCACSSFSSSFYIVDILRCCVRFRVLVCIESVLATTRPETLFGDVALAVYPQ